MALDLNTLAEPIDPTEPEFASLLANLQGNILKSHGRNRTVNLFLTFAPDMKEEVEGWIGYFTRRYVTSALRQMQQSREFKENGISGGVFATLSLSAEGYEYLDVDLTSFREEKLSPAFLTTDCLFKKGMKAAQSELNDPDPATWEFNKTNDVIHALVLLADEQQARLTDVTNRVLDGLDATGILAVPPVIIEGVAIRDESNQPLEHFGYRDGISQPLFLAQDVDEEAERFGISEWDPSAPLSQILVSDPLAEKPDSFGSYFVFRKLKQHVAGFLNAEEQLADKLFPDTVSGTPPVRDDNPIRERAGALVVGRFENGIPVTVNGSEQGEKFRDFNNFNHLNDQDGARCPFQGHTRKTNPRGDTRKLLPGEPVEATDKQERGRRITRRGITFGVRFTTHVDSCGDTILDEDGVPMLFEDGEGQLARPEVEADGSLNPPLLTDEVGLLFQCYQSSIPNQFGFIQKGWADNADFATPATGLDPVIGQLPPAVAGQPNPAFAHSWPVNYDDPASPKKDFGFGGFVEMQGGEFFFTPSVSYLMQFGESIPSEQADIDENKKRTAWPEQAIS